MNPKYSRLYDKAKKTVAANLIRTSDGNFFAAGANQFRTLWVRDFCFSVPGLLCLGYHAEVKSQLNLIYKMKSKEGYLPRGIDTVPPQIRVLFATGLRFLPNVPSLWNKSKLKPEYFGEHNTPAFDSIFLFLKALCDLADYEKKDFLLSKDEIINLLAWYQQFWRNGFLYQPAFSDWQDSARREGVVLFSQLQFLEILTRLSLYSEFSKINWDEIFPEIESLKSRIDLHFFDPITQIYKEFLPEKNFENQYSLDSHCLILSSPWIQLAKDKKNIYKNLKAHSLWKSSDSSDSIPGIPIYPFYPKKSVSWTTKAVGLRHYHDNFHWGWLIADSARAAFAMNDFTEGERILDGLQSVTEKYEYLAEIYADVPTQNNNKDTSNFKNVSLHPVQRFLYKTECPFTWTAAKCIEAIHSLK